MFRKFRARTRARRAAKLDAATAPQPSPQPPPTPVIPVSTSTPLPPTTRASRTPSDSSPHITRSPSLPHTAAPVAATPTTSSHDLHAVRARTDMGTRADTSLNHASNPSAPFAEDLYSSPVVVPSSSPSPSPSPSPSTSLPVSLPVSIPVPVPISIPTSSSTTPIPATTALTTSVSSTPITSNDPGLPHHPDRNRRLSLDGNLPPGAIRPDDSRDNQENDDITSEGVFDVFPEAFRPCAVDVSACSKAGWEPMRGPIPAVPPTHTVEVRKENQDAFCVFAPFATNRSSSTSANHTSDVTRVSDRSTNALADSPLSDQIFLGVFDGHGAEGRPIAHYARDYISDMAREAARQLAAAAAATNSSPSSSRQTGDSGASVSAGRTGVGIGPTRNMTSIANAGLHRARLDTLKAAFSRAERALTESDTGIDHVFSGTTAVVTWLFGRQVYTAWTGDSRCVIGRNIGTDVNGRPRFKAVDLSHDQKPVRADEKRRVRVAGGRIARWQRNMGPLRVWLPRDWTPGLAMTRSIGDTVLSEYGVSPVPEVTFMTLGGNDSFMVLASDGVWEFMTSQEVVDFVGRMRREGRSAREASESLVREAVRRWRRNEVVVDDTTAVVMYMNWAEDETVNIETSQSEKKSGSEPLLSRPRKVFSRTRAKVSLKPSSNGVHLISENGQLSDFVCKNDSFQGL